MSFNLPDAGPLFSLSCRVVLGRTSGRAELESPPIKVSDINDVALSVAQLDRRVRFAGGARAGPKLVTMIKADLARRT